MWTDGIYDGCEEFRSIVENYEIISIEINNKRTTLFSNGFHDGYYDFAIDDTGETTSVILQNNIRGTNGGKIYFYPERLELSVDVESYDVRLVIGEVHQLDPKYIKDMYYETDPIETVILEEQTITVERANTQLVLTCDISLAVGKTYTVDFNGTKYECVAYELFGAPCIGDGHFVEYSGGGNNEPFLIVGGYNFLYCEDVGTYTLSISTIQQGIHYIHPKYIKDMYGMGDLVETIVVEEQTVVTETDNTYAEINYNIDLIAGETYIINFDGNAYTCVAWRHPQMPSAICVGDGSQNSAEGYGNGEPFFMYRIQGEFGDIYPAQAGSHTVFVTAMLPEVIKIPEKYLPYVNSNIINGTSEGSVRTILENEASGKGSFAEGYETVASGYYSHSEGRDTKAVGGSSHAEGESTIASGFASHAEGYETLAPGNSSHAEGSKTMAFGIRSHAEGNGSRYSTVKISGDAGSTTYTVVSMPSIMRPGIVIEYEGVFGRITSYDNAALTITVASSLNYNSDIVSQSAKLYYRGLASGDYSHAEGYDTLASGYASHAEGELTIASGSFSHAEGRSNEAAGGWSHAEGSSDAYGDYSHAEGRNTIASGYSSHSEGMGRSTTFTIAEEVAINSLIYKIKNVSQNDIQRLQAGQLISYNDLYAKIVSYDASTLTIYVDQTLNPLTAMKVGAYLYVYEGISYGEYSHTEGNSTVATSRSQHVQGEYNIVDVNGDNTTRGTYAHIVGNGDFYSGQSNAHTLDWNGNAWFQGDVYVGSKSGVNKDEGSVKLVANKALSFVLTDTCNGFEYIIQMQNGNLVSFCRCDHIEVVEMPTKTNYVNGEPFDSTGMKVVAVTQDGISKTIDNYTCSEYVMGTGVEIQYVENEAVYTTNLILDVSPYNVNELIDFDYTANSDGTYTITGWKETLNGEPSTEMIIPDNHSVIV